MNIILKKSLILLVFCLFFLACAKDEQAKGSKMSEIQKNGILVVGVKEDVPFFGLKDQKTGEVKGFEIDIAKLLAKKLLGDEKKLKLVGVNAKTRGPLLDNSSVDLVIATYTISEARKKVYNFSTPYYKDSIALLVKKDRHYTGLSSMDGAIIGVAQATNTKKSILEAAKPFNIKLSFSEFPDYASIKVALDANRVDAYAQDKSILLGYKDENSQILKIKFKPQEYGIATKKGEDAWAKYINDFVLENKAAFLKMQEKWGLID